MQGTIFKDLSFTNWGGWKGLFIPLSHNHIEAGRGGVARHILEISRRLFVDINGSCGFATSRGMVALDIPDQFDINPWRDYRANARDLDALRQGGLEFPKIHVCVIEFFP